MLRRDPPPTIATLIDDLGRIREELLSIQLSLEKLEPGRPLASDRDQGQSRRARTASRKGFGKDS
jgi:hypothetical protein